MGLNRRTGLVLGLTLLVFACMPTTGRATTTIVGGSENWHFGFNYSDWAHKTAPFYQNDTLVFKYDPPNSTTFPHNVFLLKNMKSFRKCNFIDATLVANVTQGGGSGFEFMLEKRKAYYFACAVGNGTHCDKGMMKFAVWPLKPVWNG